MSLTSDPHAMGWLIRKLESITPLSDLNRRAIESLSVSIRRFEPRQDIVRDQDRPSQCCLVLQGWVHRYKLLDEGRRQIVSFHVPGDLPDLQSLHLRVMDHSVATLTACTLAFIPHEHVRDLLLRFPSLSEAMWRDTLIDAAIFREWLTGVGRRSSHARIAHLFCEMYVKLEAVGLAKDHRCSWPLTQGDLADALGLSNVHVNRVLQDLRGQGLITLRGGMLTFEDWAALSRLAEFDPTYLHLDRREAA